MRKLALGLALLAAGVPGAARGEDEVPPGRVHLAVEREKDVANDRAVATLELTDEGDDPAQLADRVSRRVNAALARAKREPGVEVRTGGIQTRPVFQDGRLQRWRATQQLVLETDRLEALPGLLAELQADVPLASVDFTVSPQARRAAEDELLGEALLGFRARAERVREVLGARSVSIHELYVDTGASGPAPLYRETRAMAAQAEMAPPPLAAGTSQVTVTVRGSVQLDLP